MNHHLDLHRSLFQNRDKSTESIEIKYFFNDFLFNLNLVYLFDSISNIIVKKYFEISSKNYIVLHGSLLLVYIFLKKYFDMINNVYHRREFILCQQQHFNLKYYS
jgi:hypothetical protein